MSVSFNQNIVTTTKTSPTQSQMVVTTPNQKVTLKVDDLTGEAKVIDIKDLKSDASENASDTKGSKTEEKAVQKAQEEADFVKTAQQTIIQSIDKANPFEAEKSIADAYLFLSQDKINELKQFLFEAATKGSESSSKGYNLYLQITGQTAEDTVKNPFGSFGENA